VSEPGGPLPGPIRPPTDDPKTNVLYFALVGCTWAAFLVIVMAEGPWRWLAVVPVVLGVWLFVKVIRRARETSAGAG
jgi:Flp pilus assembly protein TadB